MCSCGLNVPLAEGFVGKDIFIRVLPPNMVSKEIVAAMAKDPDMLDKEVHKQVAGAVAEAWRS